MAGYDYDLLDVQISDGVATVTIDNPPINLMTSTLFRSLAKCSAQLADDDDVRVVVLRSAVDGFFIAHFDVAAILEFPTDGAAQEEPDLGGFDRLFGPASLEDVDLSLCARRRGRRLVAVLDAVALHLDLGDGLGDLLDAPVARAVTARNRLLLRWKHLATRTDAADHLVGLWRTALEAGLTGDRETLEGIALAMDRLGEMAESRATLSGAAPMDF